MGSKNFAITNLGYLDATFFIKPFFPSKSKGSISKIWWFHGIHGTHANYAPALNIIYNYVKQYFFTQPFDKILL